MKRKTTPKERLDYAEMELNSVKTSIDFLIEKIQNIRDNIEIAEEQECVEN